MEGGRACSSRRRMESCDSCGTLGRVRKLHASHTARDPPSHRSHPGCLGGRERRLSVRLRLVERTCLARHPARTSPHAVYERVCVPRLPRCRRRPQTASRCHDDLPTCGRDAPARCSLQRPATQELIRQSSQQPRHAAAARLPVQPCTLRAPLAHPDVSSTTTKDLRRGIWPRRRRPTALPSFRHSRPPHSATRRGSTCRYAWAQACCGVAPRTRPARGCDTLCVQRQGGVGCIAHTHQRRWGAWWCPPSFPCHTAAAIC